MDQENRHRHPRSNTGARQKAGLALLTRREDRYGTFERWMRRKQAQEEA